MEHILVYDAVPIPSGFLYPNMPTAILHFYLSEVFSVLLFFRPVQSFVTSSAGYFH
jgi:hypothetical protein